jgi:hypothetical protein
MILASVKGVFIALIILFMFMGWLFQTVNKIKQGIEKNKRIRRKGKLKPQANPFEQESAEDFFARMDQGQNRKNSTPAQASPKPKLKLKPEHQAPAQVEEVSFADNLADQHVYKLPEVKSARGMSDKKSGKSKNIVDKKNLKSLKKAIIINEVLGRPKAYEL